MPRTRLVLLIWVLGTILLLGAWGQSLFRKSVLRHNRLTIERQFTLSLVGGSVELGWARIKGNGRNRTQVFVFDLKDGVVPGGVPESNFGRFYYFHRVLGTPPNDFPYTILQCPIWALLLLFTVPCFLLYCRYQNRQRGNPELRAAEGGL